MRAASIFVVISLLSLGAASSVVGCSNDDEDAALLHGGRGERLLQLVPRRRTPRRRRFPTATVYTDDLPAFTAPGAIASSK